MLSIKFLFFFIPLLSIILILVNLLLAPHMPYKEKKTPFECGYHSFLLQNRTQFTVSFFVFAILFLLFDLEIVLIYPLSVSIFSNGIYGITFAIIFIAILTVGFVLELGKGALKIDSAQYTPDPHRNLQLLQSKSWNNPLNDLNMQQYVTKVNKVTEEAYTNCRTKIIPNVTIETDTNCKPKFLIDVDAADNNNPREISTGCKNKLIVDVTTANDNSPEEINNSSVSELLKSFKDFKDLNNLHLPKLSSYSYTDIDNNTFDLINKGFIYKHHLFEFLLYGINSHLALIFPVVVCIILTNPITKAAGEIFDIMKQQRLTFISILLRAYRWIIYVASTFMSVADRYIGSIIKYIKDIVANLHWTGDYHLFAVLLNTISRMVNKLTGTNQNITSNPYIKKLGVLSKNFTRYFISVKGILSSTRGFLPPNLNSTTFTQLNLSEQFARLYLSEGDILNHFATVGPEIYRILSYPTTVALIRQYWTPAIVKRILNEIIGISQDSTIPREVLNNIICMVSRWLLHNIVHRILGPWPRNINQGEYGNISYIQNSIGQISPGVNNIRTTNQTITRVVSRLRSLRELLESVNTLIEIIETWGLNNMDLQVGIPGESWGHMIHDIRTLQATIAISYNHLLISFEEALAGYMDMPEI